MTIARLQLGVMILGVLAAASCSSGKKGTLPAGSGYCESTCAKSCGSDSDCNTSQGELCCDYGEAGKSCAPASQCPIACSDDSTCNTLNGQACVRVDLSVPQKYCEPPSAGIQLCQGDTDCTSGKICCTIYNEPVCLPPTSCPKACGDSSECNTASGEICCTTVSAIEPALSAGGLCLNPANTPCPKACSTSQDCAATGDLCCNGICQATCRQTCQQSSDCNQQICCKSAQEHLPPPTKVFSTGPHCAGTPSYTCAQCSSLGYCSAGYCPGCTTPAGSCTGTPAYSCTQCQSLGYCSAGYCPGCTNSSTGSCTGTPTYTCSDCGSLGYCSAGYCPGCTNSTTGGSCTGSRIYSCSTFNTSYMSYCVATPGCSWNSSTLICSGTPQACTAITSQTTCSSQLDCSWSTAGACSGTPTPCAGLNSTTCSYQPGCSYNSTTCSGTPTACSQLSGTDCTRQPGCSSSATTCSGTPTACANLTISQCQQQPGCSVVNN